MNLVDVLILFAALLFVLGLMIVIGWLFKKYGGNIAGLSMREGKSLKIKDSLLIDPRRKLYLIQNGKKYYVILTGPNGDVIVDNDAKPDLNLDSLDAAAHDKKHG